MKLTVIRNGIDKNGITIVPGDVVRYIGHVPGGMIKVELESGLITIYHPACFKELS